MSTESTTSGIDWIYGRGLGQHTATHVVEEVRMSKKDEEKVLDDVCGICYDNHTMIESVTTQCGHTFGNCCIQTWITTKSNRKEVVTCPYCINKITSMNGFRARPTPKSLKK